MTDSELANYVRDHSCWRADSNVTVADWDRGILAIVAEARAAALDEARAAVEATGSEYIPDLLAAIDALREGADKSS